MSELLSFTLTVSKGIPHTHTAAAVSLFVLNFWNVFCHVSSQ
jgi:hypothetical protein